MIKIHTLPLGSYQTNCYIVRAADAKSCAVIDPGYAPETILAFLEKEGLALDAVFGGFVRWISRKKKKK